MSNFPLLARLGWQSFFQQQLTLEEWENSTVARVVEQHRSQITVLTENALFNVGLSVAMPRLVVGDWVLLDQDRRFERLLDRKTCFYRRAPGSKLNRQLIAANIDTAFLVSSLNEDFNLNRIERFLALVKESGVEPVVVLSKSDLAAAPEGFINSVLKLDAHLVVEAVNCLDAESVATLSAWLKPGNTVCVLGSSGVGKSTLINTLLGSNRQITQSIRADDGKGRHTTSRRSLIPLDTGGLILDTPGLREIQLADCEEGIRATFSDIERLARQCRYLDCQHQTEPGCSVRNAVATGDLDQRRLDNFHKLLREESLNSASLREKRANDKALGRFYKQTAKESRKLRGR